MPRLNGAPGFGLLEDSPVRAHLFAAEMVGTGDRDFGGLMVKEAILNAKFHACIVRIPHS